jgi:K+-sensing histidine kinase KdpD
MDIPEKKRECLKALSHDIRTPLSSVKEAVSLIGEDAIGFLNETQKKCLHIAKEEIVRVNNLYDLTIEMATLDMNSLTETKIPALDSLFEEALKSIKICMESKSLKIEKNIECKELFLFMDEKRLCLLIATLVQCACRHAQPNTTLLFHAGVKQNLFEMTTQIQTESGHHKDALSLFLFTFTEFYKGNTNIVFQPPDKLELQVVLPGRV